MDLSNDDRKSILRKLGAKSSDLNELLQYVSNTFSYNPNAVSDEYLLRWVPLLNETKEKGAAVVINEYLVDSDFQINFKKPDAVNLEIFESFAGSIPIISTDSDDDFESLVQNIVFKDKVYPHIKAQGAQFVHGKNNRFIILSHKPYSNTTAESMEMDGAFWREKSFTIRKYHECVHFYTMQYYGSAKNNLHDELIADFCGIWEAFSYYNADYFRKFLAQGRLKIYIENLSANSAMVVEKLALMAAAWIEEWSKSNEFLMLSKTQRIDFLCKKDLLAYAY